MRKVVDKKEARGLPIIFRSRGSKIEVCYDTTRGLPSSIPQEQPRLCILEWYMNGDDVDKVFRYYKIAEDNLPPVQRLMDRDPRSETSLAVARGWLTDCVQKHKSCRPSAELQTLPRRLIHVGDKIQHPFLVATSTVSNPIEWASLSYCWGAEPSMKLTTATVDKLEHGLPLDAFDATISDAILVTRALGLSYIWVDALCIVQDAKQKEWAEEASRMHEIYGGSTITLVVASSASVREGFLKERELNYVAVPWPVHRAAKGADNKSPAELFLAPRWDESKDKLGGPWSDRGWTMQESFLPNRLLHYNSSQMIWKCCEEHKFERGLTESVKARVDVYLKRDEDVSFESGWLWELDTFLQFKRLPNYLPGDSVNFGRPDPESFHLWYHLVEDYSRRKFSYENDRLVAISGLARIFGDMIKSRGYVAGLWTPDLIRGLAWRIEDAKLIDQSSVNSTFPSWSWVSTGGQRVVHITSKGFHVLSKIDDLQVDLVNPQEPFGSINGARITITGPLKKISKLYHRDWKATGSQISQLERWLSECIEQESRGQGVKEKYVSPNEGHFAVLQMLTHRAALYLLILEPTGQVSNSVHVYRRLGICTLQHGPKYNITSPKLMATRKRTQSSLAERLAGPRVVSPRRKVRARNDVVEEMEKAPWERETVTIV